MSANNKAQMRNIEYASTPLELAPILRKLMKREANSIQDRLILLWAPWITEKAEKTVAESPNEAPRSESR